MPIAIFLCLQDLIFVDDRYGKNMFQPEKCYLVGSLFKATLLIDRQMLQFPVPPFQSGASLIVYPIPH